MSNDDSGHRFGGDWTTAKLEVISRYLQEYTKALKNQPFRKIYIDAFAGTGYREVRTREGKSQTLLLPDLADPEPQSLLEGSALSALSIEPAFDGFVFVEKRADRCDELEKLKLKYPAKSSQIEIRHGEANDKIREICRSNWRNKRAVLFLDPYGMQVEWETINAIAATRAIDLWLLFPLGIGVNRLLTRSGDIPGSWRKRLDLLLGTQDWYEAFYRVERTPTLFDSEAEHVVKASTESIGRFFVDRLRAIFAGVADRPGVLRNSSRNPLYLLCFAAANERGAPIAVRIANHLLRDMQ
ncbi:three-Cys-motif partner protein TcmP [bacterium]|nr:three-Cys-motif partner protein TcmP [bacterium]